MSAIRNLCCAIFATFFASSSLPASQGYDIKGFCSFVFSAGGGIRSKSDIEKYLENSSSFIDVRSIPESIFGKLVAGAIAMISQHLPEHEDKKFMFHTSPYGPHGLVMLKILGFTEARLESYLKQLLTEYFNARIEPGLRMLKKGSEFRTAVVGPGASLQSLNDTTQIDRDYAESVPGVIFNFVQGAWMLEDKHMARQGLDYMLRLSDWDSFTIDATELIHGQRGLSVLSERLFFASQEMILSTNQNDLNFNVIASTISALGRITDDNFKAQANSNLMKLAKLLSSEDLHRQSFGTSVDLDISTRLSSYASALAALEANGNFTDRKHVIGKTKVQLVYPPFDPESDALDVIQDIKKSLLNDKFVDFMASNPRSENVIRIRSYLTTLNQSKLLLEIAERIEFSNTELSRTDLVFRNFVARQNSLIRFYFASGGKDKVKTLLTDLEKEIDEIADSDEILKSNDVLNLGLLAFDVKNTRFLSFLSDYVEKNYEKGEKKTDLIGNLAAMGAGEFTLSTPTQFPFTSGIPRGVSEALQDWERAWPSFRQFIELSGNDFLQNSLDEATQALDIGNLELAHNIFLAHRHADGLVDVGDAYLRLHAMPPDGSDRHYGAIAFGCFLEAAIIGIHIPE